MSTAKATPAEAELALIIDALQDRVTKLEEAVLALQDNEKKIIHKMK